MTRIQNNATSLGLSLSAQIVDVASEIGVAIAESETPPTKEQIRQLRAVREQLARLAKNVDSETGRPVYDG